jgi:hypothetical protein
MGTAWQAQKDQPFGKDNLRQVFTIEKAFPHVVFPCFKEGFLDLDDISNLFAAMPSSRTLWKEYNQVKDIDWTPLCEHNPYWKEQEVIDDTRPASTSALQCCFTIIWIW